MYNTCSLPRLHRLRARNAAETLAGRSRSPSPTPLKLLVRFNLLQSPPVHQGQILQPLELTFNKDLRKNPRQNIVGTLA
ncbi:hypothetical protein F2Q70_00014083 [Brassica cretica]|uniref:Uncharacterized protein n=1 Tax=Brassica cretica TaxID=69181 RepID=A0A8S9I2B2_BRACR|nr:hypothetical protein F2Q70_00014083 [Brassica cretica]